MLALGLEATAHYGLAAPDIQHRRRRAVCRADRRARSGAGLEAAPDEGFQPQDQSRAGPRPAGARRQQRAAGISGRAGGARRLRSEGRACAGHRSACRSPASTPSAAARSAKSPIAFSNRRRSAPAPAAARNARADRALPRHRRRSRRGRGRAARARRRRASMRARRRRSTCSRAAPASSPRAASTSTRIRFSTAFGRGFDYYTGFVFELHDPRAHRRSAGRRRPL